MVKILLAFVILFAVGACANPYHPVPNNYGKSEYEKNVLDVCGVDATCLLTKTEEYNDVIRKRLTQR